MRSVHTVNPNTTLSFGLPSGWVLQATAYTTLSKQVTKTDYPIYHK